ncbi:MAG: histidine phosphatase family protein [Magnetococcales bacterium]|nr:histidine phosphatase family protein [Magnetococcales bacterium]
MRLFFVRHGQSNYNERQLCNDDPDDDVHLTQTGILQAEGAGLALQHVPLQLICTSPLPRARQTAEIINRHHNLPIRIVPGLRDIRSGFNGKPVSEYFAAIAHAPLSARPPGGESLLDYKAFILATLQALCAEPVNAILAVAHEETLRIVHAWFHRMADDQLRDLHFANGHVLEFNPTP